MSSFFTFVVVVSAPADVIPYTFMKEIQECVYYARYRDYTNSNIRSSDQSGDDYEVDRKNYKPKSECFRQ